MRVKGLLAKLGLGVYRLRGKYAEDGIVTVHSASFRDDARFRAAYARGVQASNGVDPHFEWRVHTALWAAQTSLRVDGDYVECGVNAGFMSSAIMQWLDWSAVPRRFFLVDTFAGPVLEQYSESEIATSRAAIAHEAMQAGAYVTDLARVRANFAEWANAVVVQGTVPHILHGMNFGRVAFLHLDMNCAYPEQEALQFFWEHLSSGAIVLLDDYAYLGHGCQKEAIDQVAGRLGTSVLALPTGQGIIVR
jgi:hypothetical protein